MTTLDITKAYAHYYKAATKPELVTIPAGRFLTIEGKGNPEAPLFGECVQALYSVAYTIRSIQKAQGLLFKIAKMEGLWWINANKPFEDVSRDEWFWKLMIQMPQNVSASDYRQGVALAMQKKPLEQTQHVKFESMEEGLSVQMLHTGPYTEEQGTLARMRQFMEQHQLVQNGLHHEVYLSDPRKTEPAKLKTILRIPVR